MPDSSGLFSSPDELNQIAVILQNYMRLPFASFNIPGSVMEGVLGHVRHAAVLRTYDFIDVVDRTKDIGWQVKSTMAGTPVTWKRAKIPDSSNLIALSEMSSGGLQALGRAIIHFCNAHTQASMRLYKLKEIGYARLIIHDDGNATYFEKSLCTDNRPELFNASECMEVVPCEES